MTDKPEAAPIVDVNDVNRPFWDGCRSGSSNAALHPAAACLSSRHGLSRMSRGDAE
jgi:hypothetical protein